LSNIYLIVVFTCIHSLSCTTALSVTHSTAAAAVCGLWPQKCLPFMFFGTNR